MSLNALAVGVSLMVFNVAGLLVANYFGTIVFLDTVGTAIAGLAFGPWAGAAVGLATNVVIGALLFPPYLKFFYVNVVCGFAWGLVAKFFPLALGSDVQIAQYILAAGCVLGLIATVLSAPLRIRLGFKTDHLLDQVSGQIRTQDHGVGGLAKIFSAEFLLGHFLDKTISTTVGVMFVLEFQQSADVRAIYHDLIELLGGFYYVAMGFAIKTLGVKFNLDETVALLGPLGFFGALLALPVLLRLMGVY